MLNAITNGWERNLVWKSFQSTIEPPKEHDVPLKKDVVKVLKECKVNGKHIFTPFVGIITAFMPFQHRFNNSMELKRVLSFRNDKNNHHKIVNYNMVRNNGTFDPKYLLKAFEEMNKNKGNKNLYENDAEFPSGNYLYYTNSAFSPIEFSCDPLEYVTFCLEWGIISENAIIALEHPRRGTKLVVNDLDKDPFVAVSLRRYGEPKYEAFDGRATATVLIDGAYECQVCAFAYNKWYKITDNHGANVKVSEFVKILKGKKDEKRKRRISVYFRQFLINGMDLTERLKYDPSWLHFMD